MEKITLQSPDTDMAHKDQPEMMPQRRSNLYFSKKRIKGPSCSREGGASSLFLNNILGASKKDER